MNAFTDTALTCAHWIAICHVQIGGQKVATASRDELTEAMVSDCLKARELPSRARIVFDVNGHGLSLSHSCPEYRRAMEAADIVHADGGFLVTLSRWLTPNRIAERSATTDMIHDFAMASEASGLSFYILGGTEEVNAECVRKLGELYPRLRVVGRRNGYFNADQEGDVLQEIEEAGPDVLWVGLGKPKEQSFCARNAARLQAGWVVTCGGCFNFITGEYTRAPAWMQRMNLEWLYRMVTRPRQLLARYLVTSPHALWLVLSKTPRR